MGDAARLANGEGAGEARREGLALTGLSAVSLPSSRPDIRRVVRGLRVEAVEWAELARALLWLISLADALQQRWASVRSGGGIGGRIHVVGDR